MQACERESVVESVFVIKADGKKCRPQCLILLDVVVKGAKNFATLSGRLTIVLHPALQLIFYGSQQLGGVGE